jgi:hypothetical protein
MGSIPCISLIDVLTIQGRIIPLLFTSLHFLIRYSKSKDVG